MNSSAGTPSAFKRTGDMRTPFRQPASAVLAVPDANSFGGAADEPRWRRMQEGQHDPLARTGRRLTSRLQSAIGGHPLVAQILAQRGCADAATARAFLDPSLYAPASSLELPDMARAVARLAQAIDQGETIGVWGDFDVDGQTATALLVSALRSLGARVIYHIPVRAEEGHGVNLPRLQQLIAQGIDLLLTCDTGVAAHEAVAFAHQQGIDVVITDHHELPAVLPAAYAVVNPKRLPPAHPLSALPGVGVAYKLIEELLGQLGRSDASRQYLDLAALGIVADLAVQTGDTRYLLQRGLAELRQTQRLGLQVMLRNAELSRENLSEEHIAFALAPRLNALGRLGDANPIVEFLTTADLSRASVLATQLEGLNAQRQLFTSQVFQAAMAQIERDPSLAEQAALVLAHPAWPAGVIGIVASQLVERFRRPTVLIAAPPGELARGSARSVEGCNITAAIAAQANLLAGYGGHPMAAGLTIAAEHIPEFRRRLSQTVQAMRGEIAGRANAGHRRLSAPHGSLARPGGRPGAAGALWSRQSAADPGLCASCTWPARSKSAATRSTAC